MNPVLVFGLIVGCTVGYMGGCLLMMIRIHRRLMRKVAQREIPGPLEMAADRWEERRSEMD